MNRWLFIISLILLQINKNIKRKTSHYRKKTAIFINYGYFMISQTKNLIKKFLTIGSKNNNNSIIRKNLIDINNLIRKIEEYKAKVVKVIYNKINNIILL